MTPRHPWRRRWRETLHPLLWLVIVGGLLAVALAFSIPPAGATPTSPGQQFADEHGADVCMLLDAHPTIGGLVDAMDHIQASGLSSPESTVALLESIAYICPIHADLLQKLAARHQQPERGRIA